MTRPLLAVLLLATSAAFAQTAAPAFPPLEGGRFQFNSGGDSLAVSTGQLIAPGTFQFSVAAQYENEPLLYINGQGQVEGSIIRDRYTLLAVAAWAPFEWLQVGAEVPYILDQNGMNLIAQGVPPPLRRAFGAPTASLRWGLFHQRKGAAADIALHAGVRPPWSADNAYLDGGVWSIQPRLSFGRTFNMVRAGMEVGVVYMPRSALPPGVRNHLMFGGVISTGAPDGLRLELSARTTMTRDFNVGAVEVLAGARLPVGPMELFAIGGPGLGQREESPGTPEWRVIVGMTFGNGLIRGETQTQELTPPSAPATTPAPAPAPGDSPAPTDSGT